LLASPHPDAAATEAPAGPGVAPQPLESSTAPDDFANEPHRDFADRAQREAFAQAVASAAVPEVEQSHTADDASRAVARAADAFPAWRDTPATRRIELLRAVADRMRRQRDDLAALVLREAGKPWADADGDVCEAIDFIEYYAAQAERLFAPHPLINVPGEANVQTYEPRGVAVVISPWNFPLAICCGMTGAALITGNPVIVKPAEQTPAIAQRMCELCWEAGVPGDVLQCLPGPGETVGAALVRDPRVALIAFTGSRAVGLDIVEAAGHTPEQQRHVKQVIAEMGGKNAIIVDDSADLDEAVAGVVRSAFGYAGQKCSACSRAIVLDAVHERFVARLVEAGRAQIVGDAADPATDVPPLIDDEAAEKVRGYLDLARGEGEEALAVPGEGRLVGPHIYTGITLEHRLAREEVFGPVLAVMRATDYDDALRLANASEYKLTGGVFSRTPSHLEQARQQFRVGNLYLNRGITGSLVGRQPFGGFGLSGVGGKTGGPDYLHQFVVCRATTENTMRRGFSPEVST
jgi:RHH-type proline utilization regulon transcriptional repressor/proline dehydrogenase/delta 1-pyrroline-5-carboxylate dehydrogenase